MGERGLRCERAGEGKGRPKSLEGPGSDRKPCASRVDILRAPLLGALTGLPDERPLEKLLMLDVCDAGPSRAKPELDFGRGEERWLKLCCSLANVLGMTPNDEGAMTGWEGDLQACFTLQLLKTNLNRHWREVCA